MKFTESARTPAFECYWK